MKVLNVEIFLADCTDGSDEPFVAHCVDLPRLWSRGRTMSAARGRLAEMFRAAGVSYGALNELFVSGEAGESL
jgi:predicted RNase H-like HicB family nuclease